MPRLKNRLVPGDKPIIHADIRERRSRVIHFLKEMGAEVVEEKLIVGDYVVSERVCIERKTVGDLISSIYTGRLFDECKRMRETYSIPVLILEGYLPLIFKISKIPASSIWGALSSIILNFNVRVLPSPNTLSTAGIIYRMAYHEQIKEKSTPTIRSKPKFSNIAEQQIFLLCGLPGIGPNLAKELLKKFKTPIRALNALANANVISTGKTEKLAPPLGDVQGIGPKKAMKCKKVLVSEYKG